MQKGMKDKIILHEAGIINIKLKNNRTHRFRIITYCCLS